MNFRIALVSDGTGETVETIYRAALAQFDGLNAQVERFRGVISAEQALEVADNFAAHGGNLIVTTLVQPEVRDAISNAAALHSIPVVNMLEPLIEGIQHVTHFVPLKRPGALRQMDERYKRRVRAIEFTIQCDDGKSPQLMTQADIVLFGVSRAGKTPLAMFLAIKGYAVANVPLLPGIPPDERIWNVEEKRRVGLLISPERLCEIRRARILQLGLDPDHARYAQIANIVSELDEAQDLMERLHCHIYKSTGRSMEELAQMILHDLDLY